MSEHEHDLDCSGGCDSCGCGCDHDHEEGATVTLTMDNGDVVECAVLTIFPANDKEYIALLPLNEEGENDEGEVFLYRFSEENGNPMLENIEDDDEYEVAADAFDEFLDGQEYDEIVDAEEDDEEEEK
ncbi:DUF1292 domain-containing protein [uncultured Robinsoniella sp.]|uniref:DUF1292 domain-containing protein n=1 Tax=uncultured Robinsoniella sp. TaxID=904190 RepID=UPI00374EE82C